MMKKERGKFITIEGGDGVGKSTFLKNLESHFQKNHIRYLRTREPGGSPLAEQIRDLILNPSHKMDARTELLLYEAARADHVSKMILPSLSDGIHIICDRFSSSTLAYQGYGRGIDFDLIEQLNQFACQDLSPDLTIWLKLDPESAKKRRDSRKEPSNRLDQEKESFHEKVFLGFEAISKKESHRFITLDAQVSPDKILDQLLSNSLWRKLFC